MAEPGRKKNADKVDRALNYETYNPKNPNVIPAREMTVVALAIALSAEYLTEPKQPRECDRLLKSVTHPFVKDVIRLIFGRKPRTNKAKAARSYLKYLKKTYPWM